MTAAVMKVKTHEMRKVTQYARFPPAAMPVEKVTLTPPMKHKAATELISTGFLSRRVQYQCTKRRREIVKLVVGAVKDLLERETSLTLVKLDTQLLTGS